MNYFEAFGMTKVPFSKDIPTDALFLNEEHKEILGRLAFTAEDQSFAILSAEPGCGKSTILRALKELLDPHEYIFLYISDSKLTPRWLYNKLLEQLGVGQSYFYRGDGKKAVHEQLQIIRGLKKKKIVCVIDEAHLLSTETIEEIRFLLNCEMDSWSPMALILAGQPELRDLLRKNVCSAVRQRVKTVCYLTPLTPENTARYIRAHLEYSGTDNLDIFTKEAIDAIHNYSGGIPRMINNACQQGLYSCLSWERKYIDGPFMQKVIESELL